MTAILEITDGTTTVNLINLAKGIHLNRWIPRIAQPKRGGTVQSSSLSEGSRLVNAVFDDVEESFELKVDSLTQDQLILRMADLLQLLESARDYWTTDWLDTIVYLKAQASCETNPRYAVIKNYSTPQLNNPFSQPFLQTQQSAVFDNIDLEITRDQWQADIPGQSTCVQVSGKQAWPFNDTWTINTSAPTESVNALAQLKNGYLLATDSIAPGAPLIWRSIDNGSSWSSVYSAFTGTSGLFFFQATDGTVYAGDTDSSGTLIQSVDNGGNWTDNSTTPGGEPSGMIELTNGYFLLGTLTGTGEILRSIDNASSWSVVSTDVEGEVRDFAQLSNGNVLAYDTAGRVLRSSDNGATWVLLSTDPASSGRMILADNGNLAITAPAQIYLSSDDGITWQPVFDPSPRVMTDAITKAHDGVIYAMNNNGDLIASVDNGVSWFVREVAAAGITFGSMIEAFHSNLYHLYAGELGDIYRKTFNEFEVGRDATCDNEVYISNKSSISNITHIKISDGGVFSDIGLPMDFTGGDVALLPATPVVDDAVYFGVDTALTIVDTGPFDNLVFDLGTPASITDPFANTLTIIWEYWNGAWVTLTTRDNTDTDTALVKPDIGSVHWVPPSDWVTTAVDGVTGYWIRARVSVVSGGTASPPEQQNRDIYSTIWADGEIAQVTGDMKALARIRVQNQSDEDGRGGSAPNLWSNRVIIGLRSRSDDFQAYLNVSDEQNPSGVTVSVGTNTSFATDVTAPTGRRATYNPAGVEAMATRVTVSLAANIVTSYYGIFHAYLRARRTAGASTDLSVRLQVITGSGGVSFTTPSKQLQTTTAWELLDFGQVRLPANGDIGTDIGDISEIRIQASAVSGTPDLYLYDLILIPVDEWAMDATDFANITDSVLGRTDDKARLLDIDSLSDPKRPIQSSVREVSTSLISSIYLPITNGKVALQANVNQHYWFLSARTDATGSTPNWISEPWVGHSLQVFKSQRYLGMRGAE